MNYRTSSGQIISDQDANLQGHIDAGAVPIDENINKDVNDVSIISSDTGADKIGQGKEYLDGVAPYTSAQYDKDLAAEKAQKPVEADETKEEPGGYTLEEMVDLVGNDFTGVTKKGDKYYPDASALERAGISGLTDESQTAKLESDLMEANNRIENMINDFNSYNVDQDPAYTTYANNIRSEYDKMRRQMEDTNMRRQRALETLGLRGGTSRYASLVQAGIISEEVTQANERIADITRQEQQAIASARQAFESNSYTKFSQKIGALKDLREQKADALEMYNNKLVEANRAMQEQQEFELDVLKTQADIQDKMKTSDIKEYEFAQTQGFDGDFMDYLTAKDLKSQSQPTSYKEYVLAGGLEGTGKTFAQFIAKALPEDELDELLSPNELTLFNAPAGSTLRDVIGQVPKTELTPTQKFAEENNLSKQFEGLVGDARKANTQIGVIMTSLDQAKRAVREGKSLNAPSQGVLVAFQKLLDPTSVVRESEYARSADGLSIISRLEGMYDKFKQGGAGVPVDELEEFVKVAESYLSGYQENMLRHARRIQIAADQRGLNISSILTPDVIDMLENGSNNINNKPTLEQYYQENPEQQQSIEQMIMENPDLSDEEIIQILSPDFSQGDTSPNVGANLPQKNLNPGNVKAGGLADKYAKKDASGNPMTDSQGHLIFESESDGMEALRDDVRAKISGRSRWIESSNPTIRELGKVYAEDPKWPISVAGMLGVSPDAKTNSINFDKLINVIAKQEGYFA